MSEPTRLRANTKTVAARPSTRPPLPRQRSRDHDAPRILDALRDQHGGRWISYGTTTESFLFAAADIVRPDVDMNRRLVGVDPRCVLPGELNRLKHQIADRTDYRDAMVAELPGWTEGHYVLGDGRVLSPTNAREEIVVTFTTNPKFTPRGSLEEWQAAVGPIVANQPFALFALSVAFVGPLLRFMPPDYLNPLFELVGPQTCGKSTIAIFAASVWAGNPDSECGGGESWNQTTNSDDQVKQFHRDGFLLLDEGNLSGASERERRDHVRHAVFGMASSGQKRRHGDGPVSSQARIAMISTSNTTLRDLIRGSKDELGAMHDRMVTLTIAKDRDHGVLDFIPAGSDDAGSAMEHLREVIDTVYGTAGPAFIEELQAHIAKHGDRAVAESLKKHLPTHRRAFGGASPRIQKSFAAVIVAGLVARRFGVLPREWGSIEKAVLAVAHEAREREPKSVGPLDRIRAHLAQHASNVIDLSRRPGPVSPEVFGRTTAFLRNRDGRREALLPAASFRRAFPDHRELMRALGAAGRVRTERGVQPKLTIKAPTDLGGSGSGRVYCILLDQQPASETA